MSLICLSFHLFVALVLWSTRSNSSLFVSFSLLERRSSGCVCREAILPVTGRQHAETSDPLQEGAGCPAPLQKCVHVFLLEKTQGTARRNENAGRGGTLSNITSAGASTYLTRLNLFHACIRFPLQRSRNLWLQPGRHSMPQSVFLGTIWHFRTRFAISTKWPTTGGR